jgi:ATP-binding cassette subfamily B protein
MVWETSRTLTVFSLALRLVAALVPVSMLWVSKLIIDRVVAAVAHREPVPGDIWLLLGVEFSLAVLGDVLARAVDLCDSLLGDKFTNQVSVRLMEHASELDLASFEDPVFYDKLERARRQTTARLGMLAGLARMGQQFITLLSLSAGVFWFSPWLFLLLIACVIPAFLSETHFAMLGYSLFYQWTPQRRTLDYLRLLGASSQSAKEVKIFGLGDYLARRYRVLADQFYAENRSLSTKRAAAGSALALLGTGGYYAAYAIIVYRTVTGALSVGDLTFLAGAFSRSRANLETLFSMFTNVADQALFLNDLFEFFRMRPTVQSKPGALPAPRPIRNGFEFRKVSFQYAGSERMVLRDVSFRLEAGERIALIGENGAGKTTLVKLLARLYDPSNGVILLDGIDLRDYSVEDLRKEIGVIFQDYMRYEMAVRENIGFGRIEDLADEPRLREAARKSLAEAVIGRLPQGLEQMLGRRFDGGVDLSVGEWQKMALARAYMRDAQVLILDEPTASLDARAEYEVFLRFADLTRGRMAVLISHRFSTVRMADRILVLEGGGIREQGTHEELLGLGGHYAELFRLQAAGYK